jgi:hypothetical protein
LLQSHGAYDTDLEPKSLVSSKALGKHWTLAAAVKRVVDTGSFLLCTALNSKRMQRSLAVSESHSDIVREAPHKVYK